MQMATDFVPSQSADEDVSSVGGRLQMSRPRRILAELFASDGYCLLIVVISLINLVLVIVEIDSQASGDSIPIWARAGTFTFMVLFGVEMFLRMYAFRWKNIKDALFMLEVVVLLAECLALAFRDGSDNSLGLSILRILRMVRLTRSSVMVLYCPELRMIVCSLLGAVKPLFWGGIMLVFVFTVLGMFAVQIIDPLIEEVTKMGLYQHCQRCPRAFGSVWQSVITLFQGCIAGDSWGEVAIPLIETYPWTGAYFSFAFVLIAIAVMNVMLASVVDSAAQARLDNDRYIAKEKTKERLRLEKQCFKLCEQMDADLNGVLTFDEIVSGYRKNQTFHHLLKAIDVHEEDLETVFDVMDEDESGSVDYAEFTTQLFKMKSSDSHTMLLFLKHHVGKIAKESKENLAILKKELITGMKSSLQMQQRALTMISDEEQELHNIVNFEQGIKKACSLVDLAATSQEFKEPGPILQTSHSQLANELLTVPIAIATSERGSGEFPQRIIAGSSDSRDASVQLSKETPALHDQINQMTELLKRLEEQFESLANYSDPRNRWDLQVEPKLTHSVIEQKWHLPYCCAANASNVARV